MEKKEVRFGWIEVDKPEISEALLGAVEEWGKERGMEAIVGPLGLPIWMQKVCWLKGSISQEPCRLFIITLIINSIWKASFEKEADWVEFKLTVPDKLPEKFIRISEIILEKYKLKIKKLKRSGNKEQKLRTEDF